MKDPSVLDAHAPGTLLNCHSLFFFFFFFKKKKKKRIIRIEKITNTVADQPAL